MNKHFNLAVKVVMALLLGGITLALLGAIGWGLWVWRHEGLKILGALIVLAAMFAIGRGIIGDDRWYHRG